MTTWPVIGHTRVVASLARIARKRTPSHAYLFVGPAHVGKETMAHVFARALVCEQRAEAPCGICRGCRLAAKKHHPDIQHIDFEAQRQILEEKNVSTNYKVDLIRRLQADLALRPIEADWKVIVLTEADRMTRQAANAFLKTLEEPPRFVVLLLTTHDAELLLPTIQSRCQHIRLRPVPAEEIAAALRRRGIETERAKLIARLSEGRVGWALNAITDETLLETRREALDVLRESLHANRTTRLDTAEQLARRQATDVLHTWATWWRDVLLLQHNAEAAIINVDQATPLREIAQQLNSSAVRTVLKTIQQSIRLLNETNVNPQLVWEVLMLKLPHLNETTGM